MPLQGVLLIAIIPRAMPWAKSFLGFQPASTDTEVPAKRSFLLFTLQKACYTRSVCLSPRSCCILLFTLQRACYTRSVCLSPAKRLFIVVNVVFVVFHPQQAHRERARRQGSFRSCGEFPLVGAVGGWPVGSPWGFALPLYAGRVAGSASDAAWAAADVATSRLLLFVGP